MAIRVSDGLVGWDMKLVRHAAAYVSGTQPISQTWLLQAKSPWLFKFVRSGQLVLRPPPNVSLELIR